MFAHLQNPFVLILGLGESGVAMVRWCLMHGARVRVADTREQPVRLAELMSLQEQYADSQVEFVGGAFTSDLLEGIALVGLSPGLSPHEATMAQVLNLAQANNVPIWGEIEFFAQGLQALKEQQAYSPKIIAITGTNGKTTVTQLTGKICAHAGKRVAIAGNISPAALDKLAACIEAQDYPNIWVLELSSFQLAYTYSLDADAATILNISEDHLDWHLNMEDYIRAKARIFGKHTTCIVNSDDAQVMSTIAMQKNGVTGVTSQAKNTIITFGISMPMGANSFGLLKENGIEWLAYAEAEEEGSTRTRKSSARSTLNAAMPIRVQRLMPSAALRIRGRHNATNALASLALARAIDLPLAPLLHGLREYQGEPHRVQSVAIVNGVEYVDDSKGTNVGATLAAIDAVVDSVHPQKKIVLIAGGLGKGQDFSPLAPKLMVAARAVLLIGQDAEQIQQQLDASMLSEQCASLEQAVYRAAELAMPGDIVLLSPACASFDMFSGYAHRAQCFIDTVAALRMDAGEIG